MLVRADPAALELCARHGVKVLARGGTLGGLLSEKYLDVPPPDPVKGACRACGVGVRAGGRGAAMAGRALHFQCYRMLLEEHGCSEGAEL